ncbi:Dbl homology domain-containing protein [Peniophora sp. CONT]|nr:Dbl homology domain-containing protein [Peniophora sp. CONT]
MSSTRLPSCEQKLRLLRSLFAGLPETLPISTKVTLSLDKDLISEKGYWCALDSCLETNWGHKDSIGLIIAERGSKIDSTLSVLETALPHLTTADIPRLNLLLDAFIQEARRYSKDLPSVRVNVSATTVEVNNKPEGGDERGWEKQVDREMPRSSPAPEGALPNIDILISEEAEYVRDLELINTLFLNPIRQANPPVFESTAALGSFLDDVSGALFPLIAANRQMLDAMKALKRTDSLVIQQIGDVILKAAPELRTCYLKYSAMLPTAEKNLEGEPGRRLWTFLEQYSRPSEVGDRDLKTSLNLPMEHVAGYELMLNGIADSKVFARHPGLDTLREAASALQTLHAACSLQAWQHARGCAPRDKQQWHDLLSEQARANIDEKEQKRQSIIFELIKGEMEYVRDLENIDKIYVRPLLEADRPIIPRDKVDGFVRTVFHNYVPLRAHHRRLLERLYAIQAKEHPVIHSVTELVLDAAQNWNDAYIEYIPNYPFAAFAIATEMASNPLFKEFVESCTRHPDANRQGINHFVNRPIPRLARYELLLKDIAKASPDGHEDCERTPRVIEVLKLLLKETDRGVASAERQVQLKKYDGSLVFNPGGFVNLELLDDNRSLIHDGKLFRKTDGTGGELWVLLFDNYLVLTKPKEHNGMTKYRVTYRPIPLELLVVENFTDPPISRAAALLKLNKSSIGPLGGAHPIDSSGPGTASSPDAANDSRVYLCTMRHTGRLGGDYVLYAESLGAQAKWQKKLAEARGLKKVMQEANKVFEVETLSTDTFFMPSIVGAGTATNSSQNADGQVTGRVTCSLPFTAADGSALVAVGCAEGVWVGLRHTAGNMRKVLSLKMVTQCAMLEGYGVFLVLADKSLYAYRTEALLPRSPQVVETTQTAQKLSGDKDVYFFSVGKSEGRTLVIYMKKKGMDSIFRVMEPVASTINDRGRQPFGSRLGFKQARSDWFRVYKDFFVPSESYDLKFIRTRIAVLCARGFEIMDLTTFKSVTIPRRDDAKNEKLLKRCDSCRPVGIFRTNRDEFLLCYSEFGLFVNRQGDFLRDKPLIEWEGTAERVAWHPPYILIFDRQFIEVRAVGTGRLVQIIHGREVGAIWDGRSASQPPPALPHEGQQQHQALELQTRIHGVMNAPPAEPVPGQPSARSSLVAQHVFELVPIMPFHMP